MKKYLLFAFVFTLITMAFSSQAHATDKPMYKAHFLLFTKTIIEQIQSDLGVTQEEAVARQLKTTLRGEAELKKAIKDRIPDFDAQWVFFGPNHLDYTEEISGEQTITDLYGAFHDSNQPIYQAVEDLKKQYALQNINPYIITQYASFVKKSENIMIRNVNTTYPWADFLAMITSSAEVNPLIGFRAPYPEGYPGWDKNMLYGTYGQTIIHKIFHVFEYRGDSLVHFINDDGQPDSVIFSMGDRNVVDAFAWGNVFDTSGTDLGLHTTPDTLTIQEGIWRRIQIYPGWNDKNVGKALYIGGDRFLIRREAYPDERHIEFVQDDSFVDDILGAYAVAIPHIKDAFAMDYILVQFVKDITYPSIDQSRLPTDVKSGDEFTIYLKGDYDKMTSWIPEFQVSGIEYEILSQTNHSVTVKALSGGTATITLHHNSLLVLDDETVSVTVTGTTDIDEYSADNITISPNPAGDYIDINTSAVILNEVKNPVIKIYDVLSVIHLRQSATATSAGQVRVDVSGLAAGVYFVRVGKKVLKFVKI